MSHSSRKLGDAWSSWDGRKESAPAVIKTSRGLSLIYIFVVLAAITGISFLFFYLIYPRLREFGQPVLAVSWSAIILIPCGSILFFVFMLKPSLLSFLGLPWKRCVRFVWPFMIRAAGLTGAREDRLRNSFIRLFNTIEYDLLKGKTLSVDRVLVLMPRCLHPALLKKITDMCTAHAIKYATVTGGEAARAQVGEMRPAAVIAVACERDLVAGIHDLKDTVRVIAIPNIRPKGPCYQTVIKMRELYKAVHAITGIELSD